MIAYHDREWGVPLHDDVALFEFLTLEGAQAGLSWSMILNKRDNYRRAFAGFVPGKVARFNSRSVARLMNDAGIVRNRLKIEATIKNARGFLQIIAEQTSFADYLWRFVDGNPIINTWEKTEAIPPHTQISDRMSKDLKSRGFNFVGTTICYAFMQAVGMVNDHIVGCYRHKQLK